jgi:hypothetical protein
VLGHRRNLLDLDLEVLCDSHHWFFLSYLSIALVALVGFECEGLEHLCSCHCIGSIGLSSPWRFGGESKKLISSWVIGNLTSQWLYGASVAISWEPPIKLWRLPEALCGSGDRPQASHSDRVFHLGGAIEEITVSLRGVWGALCLHIAPTKISTRKGVNFGIHDCLHVPRLFLYPSSFTYAIYFVKAFVLDFIYLCYHIVAYLV